MTSEVPQYCLRAYAMFFSRHGSRESFKQSELDWIVGQSMKKKIFSYLLRSGWIKKESRKEYSCLEPSIVMKELLDFKVPEIMKEAEKDYAFTGLSAIEIWSDYSYVQRGLEKSPYFIQILRKDLKYWKDYLNKKNVPNYLNNGSTIGEYVILIPVKKLAYTDKNGFKVDDLNITLQLAKQNEMYAYAYGYIKRTYGSIAN